MCAAPAARARSAATRALRVLRTVHGSAGSRSRARDVRSQLPSSRSQPHVYRGGARNAARRFAFAPSFCLSQKRICAAEHLTQPLKLTRPASLPRRFRASRAAGCTFCVLTSRDRPRSLAANVGQHTGAMEHRRTLKIGDVPVFIHWSALIPAAILTLLVRFDPTASFCLCLAYLLLLGCHELAHAAIARALGLKVFSVSISAMGGLCRFQPPASYGAAFLIASAGLMAQILLLAVTVAALGPLGEATSQVGLYLVVGLTYVNGALLVMNLVPRKSPGERHATDGYLIWTLAMRKLSGREYSWPDTSATFPSKTRLANVGFKPQGFTTGIEILNDNSTPMEFVVATLGAHLQVPPDEAIKLMLQIHTNGGLMIGLPTHEQAIAVANAITSDAVAHGHKLVCRAVE